MFAAFIAAFIAGVIGFFIGWLLARIPFPGERSVKMLTVWSALLAIPLAFVTLIFRDYMSLEFGLNPRVGQSLLVMSLAGFCFWWFRSGESSADLTDAPLVPAVGVSRSKSSRHTSDPTPHQARSTRELAANVEEVLNMPDEYAIWELIDKELRDNDMVRGVWAKSLALSGGDEEKAKAIYLKLRHEQWLAKQAADDDAKRKSELVKQETRKAAEKSQLERGSLASQLFMKGGALSAQNLQDMVALCERAPEWATKREPLRGNTLLHLAAADSNEAACRALLRLGADPASPDGSGRTPYQLATGPLRELLTQTS